MRAQETARSLPLPAPYRLRYKKCVIRRSVKRRHQPTYRTVRQREFYPHPRDFDSKLIVKFDGGKCRDADSTVQGAVATWRLRVCASRCDQVATAPCTVPSAWLEGQLHGDLEGSRPASAEDAGCVTARLAERSRVSQIAAEPGMIRKVEEIEDLSDQLKLRVLLDSNKSRQAQILRDEGVAIVKIRRQCNLRIGLATWRDLARLGLIVLINQILEITHSNVPAEAVPLNAGQLKNVDTLPGRINAADRGSQRRFAHDLRNERDLPGVECASQEFISAVVTGQFHHSTEGEAMMTIGALIAVRLEEVIGVDDAVETGVLRQRIGTGKEITIREALVHLHVQSRVAIVRAADRNVDRAVRTLGFRIQGLSPDALRKDRPAQGGGAIESVGVVFERIEQTADVNGAAHHKVALHDQIARQFVLHADGGLA